MKFLAKYKDGLIMITWVLVCVDCMTKFGFSAAAASVINWEWCAESLEPYFVWEESQ